VTLMHTVAEQRLELDQMKDEQRRHDQQLIVQQRQLIEVLQKSEMALDSQAWLSIHQYLVRNHLAGTMTQAEQREYGRYLTGYCQEKGLRIYGLPTVGERWAEEHTYCKGAIDATLPGWLGRRHAQPALTVIHAQKEA